MTLTSDSFREFITYKKALSKTLKACNKSEYSLVGCVMGGKTRNVIVCGKTHNALLKELVTFELRKGPILEVGNYEAGAFHPLSGKGLTQKLLTELGIDDAKIVRELDGDALIPGAELTLKDFVALIEKSEKEVQEITHPVLKQFFQKTINTARSKLAEIEQHDFDAVSEVAGKLIHWSRLYADRQRVARDIARWIHTAEELEHESLDSLKEAKKLLDQYDPKAAASKLEMTLRLFKSTPFFNEDDESVYEKVSNGGGLTKSLNNKEAQAMDLAELYGTAKTKLLNGIAEVLKKPKSPLYEEARDIARHLPALFKGDLKTKLLAVDQSTEMPRDQRKLILEKAILGTRQYRKGLIEIQKRFDPPASVPLLFSETLRRIEEKLVALHRAATPPQKK